MTNWRRGEWSL